MATATPSVRTIEFATHDVAAPISPRFFPSGVWTGSEIIVWGGLETFASADSRRADGAAYDPIADDWRVIARGPLTERDSQLAAWTGSEMLIWGGRAANYIEPPDGAAYDPARDRWRRIANGPLTWAGDASGVWTGTEWVIASGTEHAMEVAAYDPRDDSWRSLPDLPEWDTASLTWASTQLLAGTASGVYRLRLGGDRWLAPKRAEDGPYGSLVWSGSEAIGLRDPYLPSARLASWDPETGTTQDLPRPPHRLRDPVMIWAAGKVLLIGPGLVFDVETAEWWRLGSSSGIPRQDGIAMWIGDRLFEWGGGVPGHPPRPYAKGYVLIPEWEVER